MNPKKQAEFWKEAALLREVAVQDNATYTAEEILKLYDEALEDIEVEIRKIENNYKKLIDVDDETAKYYLTQVQEDVSTAQLLQALEQAPDEKARRDILEYINSNERSTLAYAARRERYRAVEKEIYARIKVIAAKGIPLMGEMLKNAYKESYYGNIDDMAKGANVGIRFSILNDRAINEAVNAKWSGKHFSKRIWDNTDKLAEESQKLVVKALMSGEALNKTADKLAEKFQVSKFQATTLVRTETAHIHNEADFQAYKDVGIKRYKYLATLDYATCGTCQPLDGMVFDVSQRQEGVNAPVMHPRCRCTTTPDIDYANRRARDPITGKSSVIDGSVTYEQWVKNMTPQQKSALELAKHKNSRRAADKVQYVQYRHALGYKTIPRSFDKFQDLKYNDVERWRFIKLDYKRQNELKQNPELALPNADKATADKRKFTEYLFGGNNENGLAKGRAFTSRLGYDINNYKGLQKEILKKADKYPAIKKETDIYGTKYEQKIILYGNKEKPANVIVGWKEHDGKTWLTSAYIKELK